MVTEPVSRRHGERDAREREQRARGLSLLPLGGAARADIHEGRGPTRDAEWRRRGGESPAKQARSQNLLIFNVLRVFGRRGPGSAAPSLHCVLDGSREERRRLETGRLRERLVEQHRGRAIRNRVGFDHHDVAVRASAKASTRGTPRDQTFAELASCARRPKPRLDQLRARGLNSRPPARNFSPTTARARALRHVADGGRQRAVESAVHAGGDLDQDASASRRSRSGSRSGSDDRP